MARHLDPNLVAQARHYAESRREHLVTLCGDLVAAPSAQPEGDTRAAAGVIEAYLLTEGLPVERRCAVDQKINIVSSVGGQGRHIVLNGHLDTLNPGDPDTWSVPIYGMGRSASRLTGLGIGNMKAGTAALAVAYAYLARKLKGSDARLTFTAVADEVVFGPYGAAWLLENDPTLLGDALINAEGPGGLAVAPAEKGLLWVELKAFAEPGQGMLTVASSSAVARLCRTLAVIDEWNQDTTPPPADIAAVGQGAGRHELRLSANIGRIEGGSFISQVATEAKAQVDFRIPPGMTAAMIEDRLDQLVRSSRQMEWRRIKGWDPNWTRLDDPLVSALMQAAHAIRPGTPPTVRLPASDASRWRARGVPAICFGPQPTLASGVDDFVYEQDVVDCVAVYILAVLSYLQDAR